MAAIAPMPSGTASCMNLPRRWTKRTASANDSAPAHTSAEYSPSECPATTFGSIPESSRTAVSAATDVVKIAGWVFAVA